MKRIWIGVGLLLALLALGLLVMGLTERRLGDVSEKLEQAAAAENWEQSVMLAREARDRWEKQWHFTAALSDHTDMDQIDEYFAQLEVYQKYRSETDHAAACAWLSEAITDLEENHRLTWWNLL